MRLFPGEFFGYVWPSAWPSFCVLSSASSLRSIPNATPPSSARKIDLFRADYIRGGK